MPTYKLKIVPSQKTKTSLLLISNFGDPVLTGNKQNNFICGACDTLLCKRVNHKDIENYTIKCFNCKQLNVLT